MKTILTLPLLAAAALPLAACSQPAPEGANLTENVANEADFSEIGNVGDAAANDVDLSESTNATNAL